MKILLDNSIYSRVTNGGVSNYWYELSNYLKTTADGDNIFFIESSAENNNFHRQQLLIDQSKIITEKKPIIEFVSRLRPISLNIDDYYLYHSSYYRNLKTTDNHVEVTTVHDFTHNFYSSVLKKVVHNKLKYESINNANGIICISESTYNDLMRFCPPKKNQQVTIIHNGVSEDYFKINSINEQQAIFLNFYELNKSYLLFVGSRANYKNFKFVIELLKETPEIRLIVVGNPFVKSEIKLLDKETASRITLISNIKNDELNLLYNFAEAFIYPSSYEGFGIPVIEAMRAGCPVLALANSSITEISGDAGILFDNLSIEDFKKQLLRLKDSSFKSDIIEKGVEQSKKFSWKKCCEETYNFYKEIY